MLPAPSGEYLTEDDFGRISTVLLYYMVNTEQLCIANVSSSPGDFQYYLSAVTGLHPQEDNEYLSANETESILRVISWHYQAGAQHPRVSTVLTNQTCVLGLRLNDVRGMQVYLHSRHLVYLD